MEAADLNIALKFGFSFKKSRRKFKYLPGPFTGYSGNKFDTLEGHDNITI